MSINLEEIDVTVVSLTYVFSAEYAYISSSTWENDT